MYNKIKEYELIKSTDKVDFVDEVNAMITKGQQPFKSVNIILDNSGQLLYNQVMVMLEDDLNNNLSE